VSLHGRKGLGKKIQKKAQRYVMILVHLKKFGPWCKSVLGNLGANM
jgi:hypothetical protein